MFSSSLSARWRRSSRYSLSLSLSLSAAACRRAGYSDPYVKVEVVGQKNNCQKTSTIKKNVRELVVVNVV
jgi:hypothetical protein